MKKKYSVNTLTLCETYCNGEQSSWIRCYESSSDKLVFRIFQKHFICAIFSSWKWDEWLFHQLSYQLLLLDLMFEPGLNIIDKQTTFLWNALINLNN